MQSAKTKQQVVTYYEQAEIDYKIAWHLGSQLAMHYGFWDLSTKSLRQALQNENAVLAQRAGITKHDVVLDAGCGVGGSSLFLGSTIGCKVMGISLVEHQVQAATRHATERHLNKLVTFQEADFTATPFADQSFNVVWAVESVCHADDKQQFLTEAFRLLRPGGRLIVADGFAAKASRSQNEEQILERWLQGWGVNQLDTISAFCAKARHAGFKDVQAEDATARIMPSAKRIYHLWQLGRPIDWLTRALHMRSQIARLNFAAARYQYLAFSQDIAQYHIVSATKPSGVINT